MFSRLKPLFAGGVPSAWRERLPSGAAFAKLTPIVLLAVALTGLAITYMRYDEAGYKPVFGAHERVSVSDMIAALDTAGLAYRIHPDTGQILVPASKLARVRLLLAAKGVTAPLPIGLEQVDKSDPLGTSQFVQDVRFRRGLEGELAQSIGTMDAVERARVHLSIAKSSSFVVSDGEKSSASVMLVVKPGKRLGKEQIAAIISLVAGSVPNLLPAGVSVVDQSGAYLSARVDLDTDMMGNDGAAERFREQAIRGVQDLLAPTLGADNFRVSATAAVNNNRIEETREQYGDTPKVMSEATRDEQNRDRVALGVPGSLSNRPVSAPNAASATDASTLRNATTRQYAYDRNIMQIKHRGGELEKLSVAVVLSNAASPTAGQPWSAEQLTHVENILRNGLGMQAARGDQLVVSAMDFPTRPPALPYWQQPDNWKQWSWYAGYALFGIVGFLLLLRPILRMAQTWVQYRYGVPVTQDPRSGSTPVLDTAAAALPALGTAASDAPAATDAKDKKLSILDSVELPPADSGVEVLVDYLRSLSQQEPERVAEVVKQWIQKNGKASS